MPYKPQTIGAKPVDRRSAAKRGYDRKWRAFRERYLKRHPLCGDCLKAGVPVRATEVHHIRRVAEFPQLKLVESNCMPLCKACHSVRTSRGE